MNLHRQFRNSHIFPSQNTVLMLHIFLGPSLTPKLLNTFSYSQKCHCFYILFVFGFLIRNTTFILLYIYLFLNDFSGRII